MREGEREIEIEDKMEGKDEKAQEVLRDEKTTSDETLSDEDLKRVLTHS